MHAVVVACDLGGRTLWLRLQVLNMGHGMNAKRIFGVGPPDGGRHHGGGGVYA